MDPELSQITVDQPGIQGVVALLDEVHNAKVRAIWQDLEQVCGLTAIKETPFPHFTLHLAQDYDLDKLADRMVETAALIPPFRVRTNGLGVFTGALPVLFVPLVVTQELLDLHACLWRDAIALGSAVNPYYAPDTWVPHITLANKDVTPDRLECVANLLMRRAFQWEIEITELAIVCHQPGAVGEVYCQVTLTGTH